MMRRAVAGIGLVMTCVIVWASPAAADNCGDITDCLPTARSLLIALGGVLVVVGLVALGIGLVSLLGAAAGGGGLTGAIVLAGDGIIASAGAISVAGALETVAAGAIVTTAGAMMADAAASSGQGAKGTSGTPAGGSSGGVSGKPPAEWPKVQDTKLQNIVRNLFKGTRDPNRVGDGTTMDAIRNELATNKPTGGRMHLQRVVSPSMP